MPRPQRCRRICSEPVCASFIPQEGSWSRTVCLSVDEFEVLRLVDYEKKTHEQCAAQMDISRTTVTEIYESARQKLADCLTSGTRLVITGGTYRLCDGSAVGCCGKACAKARTYDPAAHQIQSKKEGTNMRIAVTYENGHVFPHFGRTQTFKLYDVADGVVLQEQVVDTMGSGHGALAGFLQEHQVDTLICGGIGGGAQAALRQTGIQLRGGVSGSADQAVQDLLTGTLSYAPDVQCGHHGHSEDHTCGDHGCSQHDGDHTCGERGCHEH